MTEAAQRLATKAAKKERKTAETISPVIKSRLDEPPRPILAVARLTFEGVLMALITCKECGKEVSDKASMCPNCGAPINVRTKVEVHFSRPRKLKAAALPGYVYISGQLVGTLNNGEDFSTFLYPGTYQLHFESNRTSSGTLEVPDGITRMEVTVEAKYFSMTLDIASIEYV